MDDGLEKAFRKTVVGVYGSLETRNIVYSHVELPEYLEKEVDAQNASKTLGGVQTTPEKTGAKDGVASYTREWFDREGEDRSSNLDDAQFGIIVKLLETGNLVEGMTPHHILGISEDADIAEAHRAYRRLIRTVHPDTVHKIVREEWERYYGLSTDTSKSYDSPEFKRLLDLFGKSQKAIGARGNALTQAQYSALSEDKKREYDQSYQKTEGDVERIKRIDDVWKEIEAKIIMRCNEKALLINEAWRKIKRGVSEDTVVALSSLWERHAVTDSYASHPRVYDYYETIPLNQDAQLYRTIKFEKQGDDIKFSDPGYIWLNLAYGWDKHIGIYQEFRESISLRNFFAFLAVREGKTLDKVLLYDVADAYDLDEFQVAELAQMLNERIPQKEILAKFKVREADYGEHRGLLEGFIAQTYEGPMYTLFEDAEYYGEPYYTMGVERMGDGSIKIILPRQSELNRYGSGYEGKGPLVDIILSRENLAVMRQIAYGKMIAPQRALPKPQN